MDIEVVLQAARDADWWECRIFTDADGQIELDLTRALLRLDHHLRRAQRGDGLALACNLGADRAR
jgi:hypothetical protein